MSVRFTLRLLLAAIAAATPAAWPIAPADGVTRIAACASNVADTHRPVTIRLDISWHIIVSNGME